MSVGIKSEERNFDHKTDQTKGGNKKYQSNQHISIKKILNQYGIIGLNR